MTRKGIRLLFLLIVTSLLSCCAPVGVHSSERGASGQTAREEMSEASYLSNAQSYLDKAAQSTPPDSHEYLLMAAEMSVKGNNVKQAQSILSQVPEQGLMPRLKSMHKLVMARIAFTQNNMTQAVDHLRAVHSTQGLSQNEQISLYELRALSYEQLGDLPRSAHARSELDLIVNDSGHRKENRDALWQTLGAMPASTLVSLINDPNEGPLRGWSSLALRLRSEQVGDLRHSMNEWQAMFPNHPASDYLPNVQQKKNYQSEYPRQIALILPLSGSHKKAGEAIRDGFLNRYYAENQSGSKPIVKIYNESEGSIQSIYNQAVSEGAEFVVGPLAKEQVYELSQMSGYQMQAPVLALNQNSKAGRIPDNFYQFALSPEDEAEQIALKSWQAGHRNAAIIIPKNNWGERIRDAFSIKWKGMGGHIVSVTMLSTQDDTAKAVRTLLNVEDSQNRSNLVKQSIKNKVNFQPRRRQDIDVIVLASPPEQARQIKPLLNFYYAHDIPVYATSSVYSGNPSASKDTDMNGIIFCDMPWLLSATTTAQKHRDFIRQHGTPDSEMYPRLFAMGVDAFELTGRIGRLRAYPHETHHGATGELSLGPELRLNRELVWAKFKEGIPRPYSG